MSDPLGFRALDIPTPLTIWNIDHEPQMFLSGDRFIFYLRRFDKLDVLTYSLSKSQDFYLPNVNRLIYGLHGAGTVKAKHRKYMMNNHAKVFLCYKHGEYVSAYVGSLNLTRGTNFNLMYKAADNHAAALITLFEQLWTSL